MIGEVKEETAEAVEKGKDFWEKAKDYAADKVSDLKGTTEKKEEAPGDTEEKIA